MLLTGNLSSTGDITGVRNTYSPKRVLGTNWESEGSDIAVGSIGGGGGTDALLMSCAPSFNVRQ